MRYAALFAGLGILLSGCGHGVSPNSAQIDPELAKFVPADTLVLVEARLTGPDSLQSTPIYQKYLSGQSVPQLDEFARSTSIDPRKDIDLLLYCSDGKRGILLGRGRFHPSDAEAKAATKHAPRFDYKRYHLIGNETTAAVFFNSTIAMAGSTSMLREILDRGAHGAAPSWLSELVRTIPAGSQIWAAFAGRGLALAVPDRGNLGNLNRIATSLETGVAYANLSRGLDAGADGTCSTEADARQIRDALKGLIGMGRLTTPSDRPELLRLYDSFQVDQNQRVLHVRANIPMDLMDPLFKTFSK